jgi:hypothetical protein
MNSDLRKLQVFVVFVTLSITCASAQKVKVGFDKSVDFSKYKTFTLREPATTPTKPILYASVMGTIKEDLQTKGLVSVEKDGDLTVIPDGGLGYDLASAPVADNSCPNCKAPAIDAQWAGFMPPPGGVGGKPQPKGTLQLNIVDKATNKMVWAGTVTQKLDPEKKDKSLQQIYTAINKLLAEYPPKK